MSLVRSLRKGCPTAISENRNTMKLWDMMKQLIEKSRVELQTLERLEDELFKGKDAQFVKMKGLITQLIIRLKTEVNCISEYNEEMSENPEIDNMSSSTMFTSRSMKQDLLT